MNLCELSMNFHQIRQISASCGGFLQNVNDFTPFRKNISEIAVTFPQICKKNVLSLVHSFLLRKVRAGLKKLGGQCSTDELSKTVQVRKP